MYRRVFKPNHSRVYRGRFRIGSDPKIYDVPLRTDKKYIAEKYLEQIVREMEEERVGLIAPKKLREAAKIPLSELVADYVSYLQSIRRTKHHVRLSQNRTRRLFEQCSWKVVTDISKEGFDRWRIARKELSAKTSNEYLASASAFLNWMVQNDRLTANPLRKVQKSPTQGYQVRVRRALSMDEIHSLLASSGERALPYMMALFTGLRRGEMRQLQWADVKLEDKVPALQVRAATTKNRQPAVIPLTAPLAEALRTHRGPDTKRIGLVFHRGIASAKALAKDLQVCGISVKDELGRVVDFHALRHSFATMLGCAGIEPRVAMALMRHSDPRLTLQTYMDAQLLPTAAAIARINATYVGFSPTSNAQIPIP